LSLFFVSKKGFDISTCRRFLQQTHCYNGLVTLISNMKQEIISQTLPYALYHLVCIEDLKPSKKVAIKYIFSGSGIYEIDKAN
jgi:hypothetical protein